MWGRMWVVQEEEREAPSQSEEIQGDVVNVLFSLVEFVGCVEKASPNFRGIGV
jgi:hypothetical protein